ncbi:hypothetical protein Anas_01853 [Armadillidium nasatum]|uniref:Uncharacterized protein n=1 Tax=Armadillidium nasatum TaxID=96803 RepID=A0A5N5SMA2_9CRUS|nr:hypothetical protein Anas_01853 [Armadillidium nasatum]
MKAVVLFGFDPKGLCDSAKALIADAGQSTGLIAFVSTVIQILCDMLGKTTGDLSNILGVPDTNCEKYMKEINGNGYNGFQNLLNELLIILGALLLHHLYDIGERLHSWII